MKLSKALVSHGTFLIDPNVGSNLNIFGIDFILNRLFLFTQLHKSVI